MDKGILQNVLVVFVLIVALVQAFELNALTGRITASVSTASALAGGAPAASAVPVAAAQPAATVQPQNGLANVPAQVGGC